MSYDNKFYLAQSVRNIDISEFTRNIDQNKAWINATNSKKETPLHIAARNRKYKIIQMMLPHFKDITVSDNEGNGILHVLLDTDVATDNDYNKLINIIRIVVSKGADPNSRNKSGITPIHLAVAHCNTQILDILKSAKANFYSRTNDGDTVMFLVCKSMMLHSKSTLAGIKTLDYLMNLGCDLNGKDNKGYSILHYAVNFCSFESVKELIKRNADVNSQTRIRKLTPLHIAAEIGSVDKLKILIKAGASVDLMSADGQTPLHSAVLSNSTKVIQCLIKHGADVNRFEDFSPLYLSIYKNCEDAFKLLLMNDNTDVNVKSKDGLTALHLASILGSFKYAKALIDHKANVNCRDNNGRTPLYSAIRKVGSDGYVCYEEDCFIVKSLTQSHTFNGYYDYTTTVVDLLIDNGSDVNALTNNGSSPLYRAAETGNAKLVEKFMELKADVNCKERTLGFTALHVALFNHHGDIAEMLIDAKADVNALTKDGSNPLHLAIEFGDIRSIKMLIKHGSDVNCMRSDSGFTPLHVACCNNFEDGIRILIEANADVNALTKDGTSPLHQAIESSDIEVWRILLERESKLHCIGKRCRYTLSYLMSGDNCENMIDSRDIWLEWTMSQLNQQKDVEMLLRLCAFVDSFDKNSCMPVHRGMKNDYLRQFECIKMFATDLHDFDLYSESIFPCVIGDINNKTYSQKFMYLYKFQVVGLHVPEFYKKYMKDSMFLYSPRLDIACREQFENEVKKMKKYFVKENVSLYELLHMNRKNRCYHAKGLNLHDIKMRFPIYHELIMAFYNDAIVRGPMIKAVQLALWQLVNFQFPTLCVEEICKNLSVINCIALIQAMEDRQFAK